MGQQAGEEGGRDAALVPATIFTEGGRVATDVDGRPSRRARPMSARVGARRPMGSAGERSDGRGEGRTLPCRRCDERGYACQAAERGCGDGHSSAVCCAGSGSIVAQAKKRHTEEGWVEAGEVEKHGEAEESAAERESDGKRPHGEAPEGIGGRDDWDLDVEELGSEESGMVGDDDE